MDTGSSIWRNKGEAYSTKVKHPHCETQGREYYTVGMLRSVSGGESHQGGRNHE